jgi:integrase/recombinase XerD
MSAYLKRAEGTLTEFANTPYRRFLDSFKLDCQIRNLTPKTLDVYFERLCYLCRYLQAQNVSIEQVQRDTIKGYILSLQGEVSPETINGRIRVYRRFFNHLIEECLIESTDPMKGIRLLKTEHKIKPVISPETVQKIVRCIKRNRFEGFRNMVMVLLLWDGMLRKKELLSLKVSDLNLESNCLTAHGKGRKQRIVPISSKTVRVLQKYLIRWRSHIPGELVVCMRDGLPLTHRRCHKIIQALGEKVGVQLYPHLIRHSAATFYIRQGGNPAILRAIMGHTSLAVTQNYLHVTGQDALESYESFSPAKGLRV